MKPNIEMQTTRNTLVDDGTLMDDTVVLFDDTVALFGGLNNPSSLGGFPNLQEVTTAKPSIKEVL